MPRIFKSINKEYLAREVSESLGLPDRWKNGPANAIVRAIFQALTEGIKRDGKVVISGLGTFEVRTVKAHRQRLSCFHYNGIPNDHVEYRMVPAKKFVLFRPAKRLKKEINATQP